MTVTRNPKYNRETCFKIYWYPKWWQDLKRKCKVDASKSIGQVALTTGQASLSEHQLSLVPSPDPLTSINEYLNGSGNKGYDLYYFEQKTSKNCIIDSREIDHMTFDQKRLCGI